jgi:hypothetical protein
MNFHFLELFDSLSKFKIFFILFKNINFISILLFFIFFNFKLELKEMLNFQKDLTPILKMNKLKIIFFHPQEIFKQIQILLLKQNLLKVSRMRRINIINNKTLNNKVKTIIFLKII